MTTQGSASWQEQVEAVANDRVSGASKIAINCAQTLIAFIEQKQPHFESAWQIEAGILQIARRILSEQPSIAPVIRLLNDSALAACDADSVEAAGAAVRAVCLRYIRHIGGAIEQISQYAAEALQEVTAVVTLSFSSVVFGALAYLGQRGRQNLRVICLESRPALEGRSLAARLAEKGIRTTLLVDGAAADALRQADVWLSGADSLTKQGVVNKLGTATLAVAGAFLGVPGYILCDTSKILPAGFGMPAINDLDPAEVWQGAPTGVEVRNRYFDVSPWETIEAVITEDGALSGNEIVMRSHDLRTHPGLLLG